MILRPLLLGLMLVALRSWQTVAFISSSNSNSEGCATFINRRIRHLSTFEPTNNGNGKRIRLRASRLYGIAEWRLQQEKICSDTTPNMKQSTNAESSVQQLLLLLPLAPSEVVFPGQRSGTILLKEGRWFDLLEEAMEDHCGVIGTILMGPDGLLPILPLCEITHYEVSAGYRGKVTATIQLQGVGRAKLLQIEQMKPFMKGRLQEIFDEEEDEPASSSSSSDDSLQQLESLLKDCGRHEDYKAAYQSVIQSFSGKKQERASSSSSSSSTTSMEAASWAATILSERSGSIVSTLEEDSSNRTAARYRTLSTVNSMDRLNWAMGRFVDNSSFQ